MKIIVAVDSFKGTLSSLHISQILKKHYEKKGHQVLSIPISDGGEGFVDALEDFYQEDLIEVDTYGPLSDMTKASYLIHQDIAFIELSSVSGINKINETRLNPLHTTTYGLGLLVLDAIQKGAKKIVLGLGGSATNDAGAGMLQALGVKYYHHDVEIKTPMNGKLLNEITSFDTKDLDQLIKGVTFEMASDVKNPLLGEDGCAYVYAKQKGASKNIQDQLEAHMTHYANIVEKQLRNEYRHHEGAGAAGGFGFGAMSFLNAKIHSGIDYMIDLLNVESFIEQSDIVFVGEGKLDKQTLFGKAPYGIAKIAKKYHKKVIGIFAISEVPVDFKFLDEIHVIVPKFADEAFSMKKPKEALEKMLESIRLDI
jgi:glycerate 2-kinase